MITHKDLAKSFANYVLGDPELKPIIEDIILGGSVARVEEKPDSDIDIVIVLNKEPSGAQSFQLQEKISYYNVTQNISFDVKIIKKKNLKKFHSFFPKRDDFISLIKKA